MPVLYQLPEPTPPIFFSPSFAEIIRQIAQHWDNGQSVLSKRELEEVSGVSYNTIWRLETGKTGAQPRTIRKIAKALGVDPLELVKGEG